MQGLEELTLGGGNVVLGYRRVLSPVSAQQKKFLLATFEGKARRCNGRHCKKWRLRQKGVEESGHCNKWRWRDRLHCAEL